jgi:hypothetical protein
MEVLDTSIANVALPHIAGDLGASTSPHAVPKERRPVAVSTPVASRLHPHGVGMSVASPVTGNRRPC